LLLLFKCDVEANHGLVKGGSLERAGGEEERGIFVIVRTFLCKRFGFLAVVEIKNETARQLLQTDAAARDSCIDGGNLLLNH
jgi:hypothetical protein